MSLILRCDQSIECIYAPHVRQIELFHSVRMTSSQKEQIIILPLLIFQFLSKLHRALHLLKSLQWVRHGNDLPEAPHNSASDSAVSHPGHICPKGLSSNGSSESRPAKGPDTTTRSAPSPFNLLRTTRTRSTDRDIRHLKPSSSSCSEGFSGITEDAVA
jgi:hypothetical protein